MPPPHQHRPPNANTTGYTQQYRSHLLPRPMKISTRNHTVPPARLGPFSHQPYYKSSYLSALKPSRSDLSKRLEENNTDGIIHNEKINDPLDTLKFKSSRNDKLEKSIKFNVKSDDSAGSVASFASAFDEFDQDQSLFTQKSHTNFPLVEPAANMEVCSSDHTAKFRMQSKGPSNKCSDEATLCKQKSNDATSSVASTAMSSSISLDILDHDYDLPTPKCNSYGPSDDEGSNHLENFRIEKNEYRRSRQSNNLQRSASNGSETTIATTSSINPIDGLNLDLFPPPATSNDNPFSFSFVEPTANLKDFHLGHNHDANIKMRENSLSQERGAIPGALSCLKKAKEKIITDRIVRDRLDAKNAKHTTDRNHSPELDKGYVVPFVKEEKDGVSILNSDVKNKKYTDRYNKQENKATLKPIRHQNKLLKDPDTNPRHSSALQNEYSESKKQVPQQNMNVNTNLKLRKELSLNLDNALERLDKLTKVDKYLKKISPACPFEVDCRKFWV